MMKNSLAAICAAALLSAAGCKKTAAPADKTGGPAAAKKAALADEKKAAPADEKKGGPAVKKKAWPTPARADGKPFDPLEPAAKLAVGAKIELWWRASRSKNPFADHGPYQLGTTVSATKAPWGEEGGLSGSLIAAAMKKLAGGKAVSELRLRGISSGVAGPDFKRGMITVKDASNEFFNNMVGRTKDGRYQIFLDADLAAGK